MMIERRLVVRTAALALVWLGVAGTVIGLVLPWARSGVTRVDIVTLAGIAFLGPLLTLLCLEVVRRGLGRPRAAIGVGAAGMVVTALVAAGTLRFVDPLAGIALGGPLVVVAALAATIGWVLLAVVGPGTPARRGLPLAVSIAAVVAVALAAGTSVWWYVEGRFVDHQTVSGRGAATATDAPPAIDTERWKATTPGTAVVGVAGGFLVVSDDSGVRALDASTGAAGWRYVRTDVALRSAVSTGSIVVAVFGTGDGVLAVALDAATGAQKWTHRYAGTAWDPDRLVASNDGRTVVLVGIGPDGGDVIALDTGTGERRWTFPPVRDGARCDVADVVALGATMALSVRCRATGVRDQVIALSIVDGLQRWIWNASYGGDFPAGEAPQLRATGDGLAVRYGQAPQRGLVLSASDGKAGSQHTTAGTLAAVAEGTLVYLSTDVNAVELAGVDASSGTVRWATERSELAGGRLLGAAVHGGSAYLLLRQGDELRVLVLDVRSGEIGADRERACSTPCTARPGAVVIGPKLIIIADQRPDATSLDVAALG